MSLPIILVTVILAISPSIALASQKEVEVFYFENIAQMRYESSPSALTEAKKKLMRHLPYSNDGLSTPEVENLSLIGNDVKRSFPMQMMSDIRTVRTDVELPESSVVLGSINTNDGNIVLNGVTVFGHIKSLQGDISLTGNTVVFGNVFIGRQMYQINGNEMGPPSVFIGEDVRITGKLIAHPLVQLAIENDQASITYNGASLSSSL
ncbi:hypothetical protein Patl_1681 [Paraglaciecola sp. T6c]|uniref:hypothetical protein n=1 Tax=Pseudoalteromonas atlantica (strain T6c / ATCC BAA-1087) TaxID=3042615 RepID=UPI00005C56F6|nr:hypothetical protein [Paraglaciecola sp. T6c]ABG40202.1 hypothetical protein Patl_1681 [Paraglaciecola sp. T6c]